MTIEPESRDRPASLAPEAEPARHAWLSGLKLATFRNYPALALTLDERPVVLAGANGAGKTNLLEAISFLSPGRGLRRAELAEIARRPGDGSWAVAVTLVAGPDSVELGTGLALAPEGPEGARRLRVNHAPVRSTETLLEYLRVMWLTPAMDGLFTGPASDRRRFVDRAVLAIDRTHGSRFNAYEKAMRGRNRLLSLPSQDSAWLDAIEHEMAELGTAIAAARREWASLTMALIPPSSASQFPAAKISLAGTLENDLDASSAADVEDRYRRQLGAQRGRDAAAGRTLVGPHLTDMHVLHMPKQAPAETCSTGEQKALLIGLVLSQARLATRITGETPLLLLDEVAAHLDQTRRAALFAVLQELGAQTFMTGTDIDVFAPLGDAVQLLGVRDGTATLAGR